MGSEQIFETFVCIHGAAMLKLAKRCLRCLYRTAGINI